ncbi:MAG: helix-turn-helix domain-containing GNAT family N-acetyltransferase [Acidobacteriota bacterium]
MTDPTAPSPADAALDDPLDDDVERIRRFNRFYTRRIGVLGQLHGELPLSQARLLFEIERLDAPPSAVDLAATLGLDPGYVSRQLAKLVERGAVHRERSPQDGRRQHLRLTPAGLEHHRRLTRRARADITGMVDDLDGAARRRLGSAMAEIEHLLGDAGAEAPPIRIREHGAGDLGWVLQRHGEIYREVYGFDHRFEALVGQIVCDFGLGHDERRERLWIADQGGRRLGSIMLLSEGDDPGAARLRLFLVEPHARGRGVGTALMDTLLDFARRRDYRSIVLSTVDALHAARRIYERVGFRLLRSHPHRDWSVDVVEQEWRLERL